jgi:hypothetical protein
VVVALAVGLGGPWRDGGKTDGAKDQLAKQTDNENGKDAPAKPGEEGQRPHDPNEGQQTEAERAAEKQRREKAAVQQANRRVHAQNQDLTESRDVVKKDESLLDYIRRLETYCDQAGGIDPSGCPADFQVAFKQLISRWRDLPAALRKVFGRPAALTGKNEDDFLGALPAKSDNVILKGYWDDPDIKKANEQIKLSQEYFEQVAAIHGVVPAPSKKPAADPQPAQRADGVLVLKTKDAIIAGVQAWVEVDGQHAADWKVGTTEVKLTIPAGNHRVAVYSIYQEVRRTIFDKQVEVAPDTTVPIDVGP